MRQYFRQVRNQERNISGGDARCSVTKSAAVSFWSSRVVTAYLH